MKLFKKGAYLISGREIVEENSDAQAVRVVCC